MIGLDACIPEDKKESVKSQLEEQEQQMWGEAGIVVFRKLLGVAEFGGSPPPQICLHLCRLPPYSLRQVPKLR